MGGPLEPGKIESALTTWDDHAAYDGLAGDMRVAAHCIAVDDLTAIECIGPATLSLSIVLNGSLDFQLADDVPINAAEGYAILYCATAPSMGKDTFKPDQRLSLVDLRYGHDHFDFVRRALQYRTFSPWLDCVHHRHGTTSVLIFRAPSRLMELARDVSSFPPDDPLRPLFLQARALDAYVTTVSLLKARSGENPSLSYQDALRIEKATVLLDENCSEKWTISRLARSVGISERKLKFGFKYINRATIHSYLIDTRIKKAKTMLEKGTCITYVAFATGFSSPSHFTKCFKSAQGISPSQYAKTWAGVVLNCSQS